MRKGFTENKMSANSDGIWDCLEAGRKAFGWDEKYKKYSKPQTGNIRRGVGVSVFDYKTGVYPISLETAACRMVLSESGEVNLQMGATDIGQGADTVFSQMAAEAVSVPFEKVHITSTQDTDISPFDTGAYASRQTYVSGKAVVKTAQTFRKNILDYASDMLVNGQAGKPGIRPDITPENIDLVNGEIIEKSTKKKLLTLADVGMESAYSIRNSLHITAEETMH